MEVVPGGALAVGADIARGSFGIIKEATLYGERVCAKV
jgi:hypothetical protein